MQRGTPETFFWPSITIITLLPWDMELKCGFYQNKAIPIIYSATEKTTREFHRPAVPFARLTEAKFLCIVLWCFHMVLHLYIYLCPNFLRLKKDTSHIGLGPTLMTSFYLNYQLQDPISYHILRYRGLGLQLTNLRGVFSFPALLCTSHHCVPGIKDRQEEK